MAGIVIENFQQNQEGAYFNIFGDNTETVYKLKLTPDLLAGAPGGAVPVSVDAVILGDSEDITTTVVAELIIEGTDTLVQMTFNPAPPPGNMQDGPFITVQLTFGYGSAA